MVGNPVNVTPRRLALGDNGESRAAPYSLLVKHRLPRKASVGAS